MSKSIANWLFIFIILFVPHRIHTAGNSPQLADPEIPAGLEQVLTVNVGLAQEALALSSLPASSSPLPTSPNPLQTPTSPTPEQLHAHLARITAMRTTRLPSSPQQPLPRSELDL